MIAACQFDRSYFIEEHRKIRLRENWKFYQELPVMNSLRSPRNRIDYNRYTMQLTNKPRKQDDQHFTPRKFNNAKKTRSFSDFNTDHLKRSFSPEDISQQYIPLRSNLLNCLFVGQTDSSLSSQSARLTAQNSMIVGSLGSAGDSRPGSAGDGLASRSPVCQTDINSDDFEYFRVFENASVSDVPGPSFSGTGWHGENCHASCDTFEDFNMNLLKIDSLDMNDYSKRQSLEELARVARCERNLLQTTINLTRAVSPIVQSDVFNVPLMPLLTKKLETEKDYFLEQKSPVHVQQARDVPSMPLIRKELEIAEEAKEQHYSGRQSPLQAGSPSVQDDASSVSLMASELETAEEIEKNQSPDRSPKHTSYCCGDHPCARLFYCQTCCKPICGNCATYCARKHVTIDLAEYLEIAQRQAEEVLVEAYLGIDVLADDMDNMGSDFAALDQKAKEALANVKYSSRRMWAAVEDREKILFKDIVEARRWKLGILQERYINLKEDKIRLSQAVSALKGAIYDARTSTLACNPDDLLMRKDMVLAEIWQIRQSRKMKIRSAREENWISFKNSDSSVLPVIANGGSILVISPGAIGDRQSNRDYKSSQSCFPYGMYEQVMQPIPRGRPIMDYDHNIVLPNRKSELQASSTNVTILGHFGENNPDNLCRPWGVTCDSEGNIIISDRSNNRIQIYREDGTLVRRFGSYGNGPCQFNRPAGIAVDARRRLIVVDKDNHRIQILTMEGEFLKTFGEHGEKQGQFCYPWDVAVNAACEIAITDTRNHRIQLFSAEGIPLRMFGGQPHLLRYLDSPRGICFNHEGKLIVTDFNNHHVLIIDYNMTEMRILKCEKEPKSKRQDGNGGENGSDGQNDENTPVFQRPQGVIAADDGSILVADSRHNSIKAFNSVGSLIYSYRPGQDEMDRPLGVALHWDGRMAFTDYGRNYVRLVRLEHHVDPVPRNAIIFG